MTAREFIQSGMIETYCLGFTSNEENILVQQMAATHPEVEKEIRRVRESYDNFLQNRQMKPSPSVKKAVMNNIYRQEAVIKKEWVPLMHKK